MKSHFEHTGLPIEDLGQYDLVVAGGGAAGTAAAITAGRLGQTVLLVEPLSFLGGTGVGAQVTPWMGNHIAMGALNEGLSAELQRDLEAMGAARHYTLDPEALKLLLERKAVEAGVTLLFEATVVAAGVREAAADGTGPQLEEVLLATRQGLHRVTAQGFVDASGDAHLARMAGVTCREGRDLGGADSGEHQPMSLRFVLGNIDTLKLAEFFNRVGGEGAVYIHDGLIVNGSKAKILKEYARRQDWPEAWLQTFTLQFFELPGRPRELWFNCPRLTGFNPLDPLSLSQAYVEGRRMIAAYLQLFRDCVAGAEATYLVQVAPLMGIREGRRIEGKATLTGEDFLERRKFDDGICLNRYPIDIHSAKDSTVTWLEMEAEDYHEIPFGCMVPRDVRGLLVAGRCISSDFTAQASYRIIPNCRTLGEAAACAAHLAFASGLDLTEVDGREVRALMFQHNMLPAWARDGVGVTS